MLDRVRFERPALVFTIVLALASGAAAAAAPAPSASAARRSGHTAEFRITHGYLDRDRSAICLGGTHQLIDSCSGVSVPLESAVLDLDGFLCRYLEVSGEETTRGGEVIEAFGLRDTSSQCPADCDADGLDDSCAIRHRLMSDCNGNDRPDRCDIQGGASLDCNRDEIPDECQVAACELDDGVIMMSVTDPDHIAWHPERGYNSFNLYRGGLSWLARNGAVGQGGGAGESGAENGENDNAADGPAEEGDPSEELDLITGWGCDLKTVTMIDQIAPALGEAIYYVVTGNRLRAEHQASIDSNGARRAKPIACPTPAQPLDVSVRTDKAIYAPGESVHIEVHLANLNPAGEVNLLFATGCKVTFRIEDLHGENIYLQLSHRSCSYDENRLTLHPGQIASYDFAWDQNDDRGRPVARIANYVIRGMLVHQDPVPDGITGISIHP